MPLSRNQLRELRHVARLAHESKLAWQAAIDAVRVQREAIRRLKARRTALAERRDQAAWQFPPEQRAAVATPFDSEIVDLDEQLAEAQVELTKLGRQSEAAVTISAPYQRVIDGLLDHLRTTREELGIAFVEPEPQMVDVIRADGSVESSSSRGAR